jgi:hypothetical protein
LVAAGVGVRVGVGVGVGTGVSVGSGVGTGTEDDAGTEAEVIGSGSGLIGYGGTQLIVNTAININNTGVNLFILDL